MTQLVAVICNIGRAVITASDHMVTLSDAQLTYEMIDSKVQRITKNVVVLVAGSPHALDILTEAKTTASPDKHVSDIAEDIRQAYHKAHAKRVIDEVLIPRLGIDSLEYFHNKHSKLGRETADSIEYAMRCVDLEATFLLAGVDDRAHLYKITNPGKIDSFDMLSCCCVGIGSRHAEAVLGWYQYSLNYGMCDAAYIVFEAKKRAEIAGGIGPETDIRMIDRKHGIRSLNHNVLKQFEEVYAESTLRRICPTDRFEKLSYTNLDQDKLWDS